MDIYDSQSSLPYLFYLLALKLPQRVPYSGFKKQYSWHKSIWKRQSKHRRELNIILQNFVQINMVGRDLRRCQNSLLSSIKWALIEELPFGSREHREL